MLDSDTEFEDEEQDQETKRNPVRARMREQEAELKVLREQNATLQAGNRELAFVKAGVDPASPGAKYFVKAYDGELTVDAIRVAAAEANLIAGSTDSKTVADEKAAWDRVQRASAAGEKLIPVVDFAEAIGKAKSEDEVKQLVAQYESTSQKT